MRTKYLAKRALYLTITLVVAMYLTVLIANAGGKIDEIIIAQMRYDIRSNLAQSPGWSLVSEEDKITIKEKK